ncbi:hypothetical protein O181_038886 [Austropuccinia psidii MF-1]|uniref:Uncharacterized protein n=1 Tax=Austropuccinia psidii MF-1 TaxID=1389203 RepID=A0A9Q3D8R3_9BASI|nr:hypothetical protein [Austropuccinia psidii MF-1]
MEILIGMEGYPIRALVDIGEKLNIIQEEIEIKYSLTKRKLNKNLRGIGGHSTSLVETKIHFFIAKGSVHIVLGRPFLSENNIRVKFPHKQAEILTYQEPD